MAKLSVKQLEDIVGKYNIQIIFCVVNNESSLVDSRSSHHSNPKTERGTINNLNSSRDSSLKKAVFGVKKTSDSNDQVAGIKSSFD